ncbi:MAG: queuosine precursor transporter [Deinococcales bacterium]
MKFRYFDLILAAFAVCLVISNIASTKTATLDLGFWKPIFDGGTFLFPITYIFGDVLTEVYGYQNARRVIWFGLGASVFSSLVFALVGVLPTHDSSFTKGAFEQVLGFVPQIALASIVAFFVGEFLNSYVLAKLKIRTSGQFFAARAISSTLVGQAADTVIFTGIAFGIGANALPREVLVSIILTNYFYKVALEVMLTPLTTLVVQVLKKHEGVNVFDHQTNFNPFAIGQKTQAT